MDLGKLHRKIDNPNFSQYSKEVPPIRKFSREGQPAYNANFSLFVPSQLDIEIGCGVGYHPIQYALHNPNRHLIAIEHTTEKFGKFISRLKSHSPLQKLLPIHDNAIRFISHLIPPESVDRYFLLYPNPNLKNSSQRWARMPFFEKLLETLKPGGTLQLATNIEFYKDEASFYMENVWGLERIEGSELSIPLKPHSDALNLASESLLGQKYPRTHFEKKYLEKGEKVYDYLFRKPTD